MFNYFLVLDLETTGVDVTTCDPVQSYIALYHREHLDRPIMDQELIWRTPSGEVPQETVEIHGITPALSNAGVSQPSAAWWIAEFIDNARDLLNLRPSELPLAAYNAAYDLSILSRISSDLYELIKETPVLDPLILDKHFDKFREGSRTLSNVARHYNAASGDLISNVHNARIDCQITARVLISVVETFRLDRESPREIHSLQVKAAREQKLSYAKFSRKDLSNELGWPIQHRIITSFAR